MSFQNSFAEVSFGNSGRPVNRLGLSASYFPGQKAIHYALDQGVNFFFAYGWDFQMLRVLRDLSPSVRAKLTIATGAYNFIWGHTDVRKSLEKRMRQFKTDHIDVFLFLGVLKPKQLPDKVIEDLLRIRDEGKVSAVGLSTHDRTLAGKLAEAGDLNAFMIRYNAAHRGAEQEIFPHLAAHNPLVISYTATRWRYLLRRPRSYPIASPLPTADQCYRFVLSNPHVGVCLTAPTNLKQLRENIAALDRGPLSPEELSFVREFGDIVHHQQKYFM